MQSISCILAIKRKYSILTKTEKKVADYILANSREVVYMTVAELSERAGVVQSAVIRCCKSLGFEGFSMLKISLSTELSRNEPTRFSPYIDGGDSASSILDKIFSANEKTLRDTAENIDRNALEKVVERISRARAIYLYGVGTSAIFVKEFQYRLMHLGYTAFEFTDVLTMKVSTTNITADDVVIAISHSGRTIPTVETLRLAKARGAVTVCITSYPKSPMVEISNYVLEAFSDEINYPIEAISARISHLSIIDTVITALSALNFENAEKIAKTSRDLIETYRYQN